MKKWLTLSGSLILLGTGLLHAQGTDRSRSAHEKKWSSGESQKNNGDSVMICDSIKDRYWGNWYITKSPGGVGLLDRDRNEVLLPCFKTVIYREEEGELELQLRQSRYTLFLLQIHPTGRRDSIRVSTRTEICPVCKGHKYMMEEVEVWGTELRSTEYRKEVMTRNERYNTIQVRITEKRKPARDGFQWQERKCKACQGSGRGILQKILVKDWSNHTYQEG
jgi:hypothetical protein